MPALWTSQGRRQHDSAHFAFPASVVNVQTGLIDTALASAPGNFFIITSFQSTLTATQGKARTVARCKLTSILKCAVKRNGKDTNQLTIGALAENAGVGRAHQRKGRNLANLPFWAAKSPTDNAVGL